MARLSYEALARINALLIAVSAVSVTLALGTAAYLFLERDRIRELKGTLLAQHELQAELLRDGMAKHAHFPHLSRDISFVLNPVLETSTWKARGEPYPINGIGLRGAEIETKEADTVRIALVGDSVFFGYKLSEEDRLETVMQSLLDRLPEDGRYHVVTVALPAWNVRDQDAFLRHHLARIDPDHVIWSFGPNDQVDSPGTGPPGILLTWNAPHKTAEQPFRFGGPVRMKASPAYSIRARWRDNLDRITRFAAEHDVPVSLLWWRPKDRALLDRALEEADFGAPLVVVPAEYRYQDAWCVEPTDCHPSRWANERVAIGLLGELVERNRVAPIAFDAGQSEILGAFAAERGRATTAAERDRYFGRGAERVPGRISGEEAAEAAVFGLEDGRMGLNGMLLLRGQPGQRTLAMEVASLGPRRGSQEVRLVVRNEDGEAAERRVAIGEAGAEVRMQVPEPAGFGLLEIEWTFAHSECDSPSACYSARLLAAELR